MPNIEFGEWITVDTTPKPRKRRTTVKIEKLVDKAPTPKMSNACMLDRHNLCNGTTYSAKAHGFIECECDCGTCETFRADYAVREIVAQDEAFKKFLQEVDTLVDPESFEAKAFYAGWKMAREFYK